MQKPDAPGCSTRPCGPHVPTDASLASAKAAAEKAERELQEAVAAIEVECEDCGQKYTENDNGGDKCKKAGGTKYHPNGYYNNLRDTKKYMCCNIMDKSAPGCKTRAGGQTPGRHVPTAASLASARAAVAALQGVSWWGVQSQSPAAAPGNDAPFPMKDAEAIASGSVVLRAHLYPADGEEPDLSSTGEVMSLRVKFASLNREKKALRMLLHKDKWDLIAERGGEAPSSDDRHQRSPEEFARISEVKNEMNRIERGFRNDPLFASLPLDMSITEDEFVWEVLPNGVVNASPTPEQEASFARDVSMRSSEPAMQAARESMLFGGRSEAVDLFVEQMRANEAAVANLGAGTDSTDATATAKKGAEEKAKSSAYVEILLRMKQHLADASVQAEGCRELGNLAYNNAENQKAIGADGGIEVVLDAMKQHPSVAEVQEYGCGAFWALANGNDENKKAFGAGGGIQAVLAAMNQHPSVAEVQEYGCDALWTLANGNDENKKAIGAGGGIEAVLAAMNHHPSVAAVQEYGCAALWNLANGNDENKKAIGAGGGIEAVLAAMNQHPSVAKVQEGGCDALWTLANGNAENKKAIGAGGGIQAVLAAMKQHPSVAAVQEKGCAALWTLANGNDENKKTIGAGGGIDVLLAAMKQHLSVAKLQEHGCGALWNLADGNDETKKAIGAGGGIEVVLDAMKQHPSVAKVQENGRGALRHLVAAAHPQEAVLSESDLKAATAAAKEAAAKFTASTVGTADTSQIMAAATEAIKEVTTRNATAKAESAKRKEDEKKATQKLKASASKEDKMEGARLLQKQALDAMKAAATAASAQQQQQSSTGAPSSAASAIEAAAVAAALASLPPSAPSTVDEDTVSALGDMIESATADPSSKKAAVLTLSALTSTSGTNAEQVASDRKTLNAIVNLSVVAADGKTADDTAIQLHAATAMANMSEEAGGSETMANVLLKDDATAAAILGKALPPATDYATDALVSAEEENEAFRAQIQLYDLEEVLDQHARENSGTFLEKLKAFKTGGLYKQLVVENTAINAVVAPLQANDEGLVEYFQNYLNAEMVERAESSVKESEQLMQKLQRKGLEVETVNLVKNLAESTADDSPEMAERLLASSGEALVGFVRDNNVQAIGPATQTLKVLMATAAPTSPALKKTKNVIVKALKYVEEHYSVHNPDAAARLRMLAPPDDLIELIDARIAILLKVRDAKMERDAAAASAIAEEHDQQIKALQNTVAVLQQRCRDLEVQVGGAMANADALRDESKRENEALRAKFEDAKRDAADEYTLVNNIKKEADDDRIAELELQLQATVQKQDEMDRRLQRVEFMVDEMSVEYLMNREIDEERVLIATDPPLEAFRRGLMSDLSSNLLQKLMGNKGAGNVVGKVAAGAAVGEVLMDTLFGAMPFGVGAVIGGLFKGAALLKDQHDREQADAVKAASIFTDVTSVENLLEMSVRAITLRHQEAIRRLENPDANRFGRWCAVAVLMYVLSEDVADTPWHFVEGCLFTLDTFGKGAPKTDDELAAEAEAKAEAHKGKESILGKISSSLSKAKDYIKGKFKDAFNSAKDGLAGSGPSGKGTLTRFENYQMISFKDLLQQNGMKICDRDGSNARFYSEPEPESTPTAGSGIGVYTVYKADVLIGPFLEIAENRARIQYTAQNPLPPVSVVSSMQGLPIAAGLTPHSVNLLRLNPNTPNPKRTAIAGAGGGPAGSSAGPADGAAAADNAVSASSGGGSKSNTLRKSYELFEFGIQNGVAGGGSGGGSVDPKLLHSANQTLRRDLDKVKTESAEAKKESAKEIAGLKSEMAEIKAEIKALVQSLARGGTAAAPAAAPAGQTVTDSKSKGSRGNFDAAARDRAISTSETQRRNVRSKTLAARVIVDGHFVATYEVNGKTKKKVKVWLVGEVQGEKNTLKIYEDSKMKKLPQVTVHLTKVSLVEEESGKKMAGFIIHQEVAEKQLTLVSDKSANVDSLKAFLESAGLAVSAASASGGAKASSKSPSKRFTWRKQKTPAAPKVQVRIALRNMDADSEYEGCRKGDGIKVIEELDDGSGFWIMTDGGKGLLHPDAFKHAVVLAANDSEI